MTFTLQCEVYMYSKTLQCEVYMYSKTSQRLHNFFQEMHIVQLLIKEYAGLKKWIEK